ncbi:MAG: cyclase family protein [Chloroflexi bacterium]|nr:cyclase family protein [Chloroflexota bacterium]
MARRIVDLTQPLAPDGADESFSVREYERPRSGHGVFHRVDMETTVGTHVVTSRRYLASGYSLSEAPIDRFFGEGVVVRLAASNGATEITQMDLDEAAGDRLRRDDIAVLALAPEASGGARLSVFASQWLWDKGVKMLVLDQRIAIGSSPSWNEERTVLTSLFANEIPVVRGATNTDQLSDERFAVMALPMRIEGVEAWPVRVVALDPGEPPSEEPPPTPAPADEAVAAAPDAESGESGAADTSAAAPTDASDAESSNGDEPREEAAVAGAEATATEATATGEAEQAQDSPPAEKQTAEATDVEPVSAEASASDAEGDTAGTEDGDESAPEVTDAKAADEVSDAESESSRQSG